MRWLPNPVIGMKWGSRMMVGIEEYGGKVGSTPLWETGGAQDRDERCK